MSHLAERILIVIPTFNEENHIEDCLRSLGYGTNDLSDAKFVVSDGGSLDRTRDIVTTLAQQSSNLFLIDNPRKFQSAGVNEAVASEHAQGRDILIRCDAHAHYPSDYVLRLAESLVAQGTASIVVSMESRGTTCFGRGAAWAIDTPAGSGGAGHRGGKTSGLIDHGHHAAFDIAWFNKVGGYDPTFTHNEDAELDYRLTQAGGKIWLDAEIGMTYFMRPNPMGLARQYRNYGAGRMRTLKKHGMRPRLRQVLPVVLVAILLVSILAGSLLHPFFFLAAAGYVLLLGFVTATILIRKRSLCALWAGPALAIMHIFWALGALRMLVIGK